MKMPANLSDLNDWTRLPNGSWRHDLPQKPRYYYLMACKFCQKPCFVQKDAVDKEPDKNRFCSIPCSDRFIVATRDQTGERNPNWKDGRRKSGGYLYILSPQHPNANTKGYIAEHVLVASKTLGRALKKGEIVHHLDKDPFNNNPANLKVMMNAEHLTMHRRMKAKERTNGLHPQR